MKEHRYFVYIMASKSRVLYTGMGSSLYVRVYQHKNHVFQGFSSKYRVTRLVYFESYDDVRKAINREKEIKAWRHQKRVALIESTNPTWEDLAAQWYTHHLYSPDLAKKQVPPPAASG